MSENPTVEILDGEAPSASARILADANRIEYEIDKRGRRIGYKQLEFIDIHKLKKIVGAETASNGPAFTDILAAASVVEIDGDPVPRPGTNLQIEALITRLGLDGINAVGRILERVIPKNDEASAAEIKN
jgi:hypothetical protein